MGFRNRSFRRKEPSKKEIRARQKIRQEESEKAFTHIIEFASEFEEKFELVNNPTAQQAETIGLLRKLKK